MQRSITTFTYQIISIHVRRIVEWLIIIIVSQKLMHSKIFEKLSSSNYGVLFPCHRRDRIHGIYFQFVSKKKMAFLPRSVIRKVFIGAEPFRRDIRFFGVCFVSRTVKNIRKKFAKYFPLALSRCDSTVLRSYEKGECDRLQTITIDIQCAILVVSHSVSVCVCVTLSLTPAQNEKSKFEATVRCTLDVDKEKCAWNQRVTRPILRPTFDDCAAAAAAEAKFQCSYIVENASICYATMCRLTHIDFDWCCFELIYLTDSISNCLHLIKMNFSKTMEIVILLILLSAVKGVHEWCARERRQSLFVEQRLASLFWVQSDM